MAVKVIALCLVLGVPTVVAVWAVMRMRQAYVRLGTEHRVAALSDALLADDWCETTFGSEREAQFALASDDWDCAGLSAPVEVCDVDRDYYLACWEHIKGTFAHWPTTALDLAETLTVNLMLNRGLVHKDSSSLGELPAHWRFPTAQGYRAARVIAGRAKAGELPHRELSKALMLYRALFEEILAAPTSTDALW